MSFVNELFERLKASTTANELQDALTALKSLQSSEERQKASIETLTLIQKFAAELIGRGQYKNAAYQYFSGFQVVRQFLPDTEKENQWLKLSADALAKASHEHIQWDDLLGGAACMSISSLLRLQTGDWNVNQHLDQFVKTYDFSTNQAAAACLYIPYDLVGAINPQNPNPSLLQRASNYTESYLMNTKPATMFQDGIKRAIEITQQKLMEFVKFPKIRAIYEFHHDIIFGEKFDFIVNIENMGDGGASQVNVKIKIPDSVKIVSGSEFLTVVNLNPKENTTTQFSLICPSGEGKEEITLEIPVFVEYQDILMNKNSLSLGSAAIIIRSEKKGDKLQSQLEAVTNNILKILSTLLPNRSQDTGRIIDGFENIIKNSRTTSADHLEKGEFSAGEAGIEQLSKLEGFAQPLVEFLRGYDENSQLINENISIIRETANNLTNSLQKINDRLS